MTTSSPTTKPINLAQLATEAGAPTGLTSVMSGVSPFDSTSTKTVTDPTGTLTAAQLDAAIAAHVAVNTDANGVTLRQRAQNALTANATFLGLASPSNVQTVGQVQTLTKECSALIRLLLGLLDSTTGT